MRLAPIVRRFQPGLHQRVHTARLRPIFTRNRRPPVALIGLRPQLGRRHGRTHAQHREHTGRQRFKQFTVGACGDIGI